MTWVIQFLPLLVFVFIAISVGRAINRARQQGMEHDAGANDSEQQRRVREIQERIRRLAAERRGEPVAPPVATSTDQPEVQRAPLPEEAPSGPFSGPFRRVVEDLERRAEPVLRVPPLVEISSAELERQQRLADEMRLLEESRLLVQRRATKVAESVRTQAASEAGQLASSRKKLLGDLADRESLRRAFVLREVLGPPVGLR
ncbi:MAG: hypothetical protein RIQ93_2683 [Verrucomicrobiota bacterium]|jgi:hypothetical protein